MTMTHEGNVLTSTTVTNPDMPYQKSPRADGSLHNKGPLQLARPPNKEVALISHINKLEDKHRARVKILNSIEDNRLNNTLKQMDFAKVTVGHSIEKQARSFQRSLAVIQQRQKQITRETYHFDHRKLKPPPARVFYNDDIDDDVLHGKLPFQMTAPSRGTGSLSLPHGPFSFKDRRREPLGRWIRYPASFRQGARQNTKYNTSGCRDRMSSNTSFQSARFSSHYMSRE